MNLIIVILLSALSTWVAHAENLKTEKLVLQVGESHSFPAKGGLSIEKSVAIKVKTQGQNIRILAVKPGSASLTNGSRRHQISVLSEKRMLTYSFLKSWVQKRAGLEVQVDAGEIILAGELLQAEDWAGLAEHCSFCEYKAMLNFPIDMKNSIQESFDKRTSRLGLSLPVLQMNPEARWLLPDAKSNAGLAALAARLGIQIQESQEAVSLKPMIKTQIYVMEIRRDFSRKWGIQWPAAASAQLLPGPLWNYPSLEFSAHALENEGQGKILASPTLLCRSGEEAEFLAGGEFPIKVMNYHAQGVVWKRYGIVLKVKPRADRFGRMSITLETEVSNIDSSRVVDGIPGLLTNRVLSHFDLEKSSLIALSGLIKNEEGRSSAGLPGLAGLPVLGALFGSQEFRENRTELVIFVKPEVVETSHE